MYYRIAQNTILLIILAGISYVYLNRMEIPITKNFEDMISRKMVSIDKERHNLAIAIVELKRDQNAESELRAIAKSNSYSNPFRALNLEWYKIKIIYLNFLFFLFSYPVIFYVVIFLLSVYLARAVFWKYYAL